MLRSGVPAIENTSKWLVRQLYIKSFKFPDSKLPDYFTAGIVRCATANFALFAEHLEKNRSLPSFLAWAKDDVLIEEEIFLDVSAACHPGPRLAFENGGHNVQKTKATYLADELTAWMENIIQGEDLNEVYSTNVDIQP
ncbi:Serine protease family S33 [Phytophthora palmivora]|uniref:Serine protease family S33 n=1 Tax=Phytophthora palmivora TaxID=4796 RepID=A0A2P4WZB5_9STRA|nr:Serine protease family S33 [Phytophthora palmivora]